MKRGISLRITGIACVLFLVLMQGCSNLRKDYLDKMKLFEDEDYAGQGVSEEKIETLKQDIRKLEKDVATHVKNVRTLGTFYKMLATEFFDGGNYLPALEYFSKAMEYQGDNHVLPYYAALSAVQLGKMAADDAQRSRYYSMGEEYYLRSLTLKPSYTDSLLGLSVLLMYELGRPSDALVYISRYIEQRPSNIRGHFIYGAALAATGNYEQAIDVYKWISANSRDPEEQKNAKQNIDVLMGGGE